MARRSSRRHRTQADHGFIVDALETRQLLSGVPFASPTSYGSGSSLGPVVVDLNGDGHLDVVSPNSASGSIDGVSVSLNTGTGSLSAPVSYTTSNSTLGGFQPFALATADFNGDGHADIASANYQSNTLSILFGDGNGALGAAAVYSADSTPDGIAVGDFNGDGHPDVVVSNRGSSDVSVYLNNGDGTFAPAVNYGTPASPSNVAVGDFNGDGHLDIVVSSAAGDGELLNNGNGTFAAVTVIADAGGPGFTAVADMNGDGKPDLVSTESTGAVSVLLNTGSAFAAPINTNVGPSLVSVAVADFNNDGINDVAVTDSATQSVDVLLGNNDGTLGSLTSSYTALNSYGIATGDLNGDNKPDVVVGSYSPFAPTTAFSTLFNSSSGLVVNVSGMSNPWLAGQPDGVTDGGDTAGPPPQGESPAPYPNGLGVTGGQVLTFSATGQAGYGGGDSSGPAGESGYVLSHGAEDGLAGITAYADALIGVFLTDATPSPTADPSTLPASLDFTTGADLDYTTGTFALSQPFYIGSGTTTTGATRQITAPAGATRLFLGTLDGSGWSNNTGSFTVVVNGASATAPTPAVKKIGGLDPGFGTNGLASHNVGFTSTSGVATDGTASVLIGPIGAVGSQSFGLTRYLADGSLDTSFGTGGVTTTTFGSNIDAVPTAVRVLLGGDILVAGTATTYTDGTAVGSEFAVAEYDSSGAIVSSFGGSGTGEALIHFSVAADTLSNDVLSALAVSSNGTIYVGGTTDGANNGGTDFAIAALTPDGVLQNSFFNGGAEDLNVAGGDDVLKSLAVQTNGDIVAAGSSVVNGVSEVSLARLLPNGSLDKKFGVRGVVTTGVGTVFDSANSVVIQPKGQIVIGGLSATRSGSSLSSDFLVQRYTAAGRLDRSFGNGGSVITSFGQPSAVTQVVLQADGSIVASGKTSTTLGGTLDVAIERLTTRGTLDTSFNSTGKVVIDLGSGVVATPSLQSQVASAASTLGAAFDAFTSSLQGVVAVTQGGEILAAGNSGANTVEAELIAAGVDLVTKVLSTLPASVLGGVKGTVSVTVTESGTTAAKGVVTITVEFATDPSGANATTSKTFTEKVNLKQGQSKPYKLAFNYPTGLSGGGYYLLATVTNGTGVPSDLDDSNNVAATAAATTIAPAFVTLSGASLSSTTIVAGKPVTISVMITNTGNVTAKGRIEVDVYLSPDQSPADGTMLGAVPLSLSLPAGKGKMYRLKLTAPATLPTGTFNLLAVIDPSNSISVNNPVVAEATAVVIS